jgi:hypothetical protein
LGLWSHLKKTNRKQNGLFLVCDGTTGPLEGCYPKRGSERPGEAQERVWGDSEWMKIRRTLDPCCDLASYSEAFSASLGAYTYID